MRNIKIDNEKLLAWAMRELDKKTREAVKKENAKTVDSYREHWSDESALLGAWWIKDAFTKRELSKLAELPYSKIVKVYKVRSVEKIRKSAEKTAETIKAICAANMPQFIDVVVEWKKNRTWGANPRAELSTGENYYLSSSIGGCGYDKESTATAEVFNRDLGVKKAALVALYRNAHMPKNRRYIHGVNFFWCSAPYFEGGCGFSCHRHVLELAGYELKASNGGKMFNTYYFA